MAGSSSSNNRRYDVFPSFSGEDVRKGFLSYLLKEFDRRSINSFIDNGIERSRPIGPELLSGIREARIAIVIFSKNYAASTWCLNELLEIHKCYAELDQMVIPVFYNVDPSDVRKQTSEFGKFFKRTCKGKSEDKKQKWMQALTDVANMAGEDLRNWPNEVGMVEKIANDVSNKLLSPSNGFGDLVGIEAHIEAMKPILCLESEEPRMIGIWGQSGIGKSTLGRALFTHLSEAAHPTFPFRNFTTYNSADQLNWEQNFLSEILGQKDLKVENSGVIKERFKDKKVLIVLDDVMDPLFLETLVGKTEWFGRGSRIIVITQDAHILKGHMIDLLYEVKIPDEDIALKILCRSAFAQDSPPDDLKELAVEVAKVAGDLPLGLRVLGSCLKGRTKEEWKKLLPGLQNGLKGDIIKILKVSYDRLDEEEQDIFLYMASLLNGMSVKRINDFFGDEGGFERLVEKSFIRITSSENFDWLRWIPVNEEIVEMHNLLEKLGKEIVRAESKSNPGKCRFLTDSKEIENVLTHQTGTESVLGIFYKPLALRSYISLDEKSFNGMFNLQFLKIDAHLISRQPNVYLPPKLKLLDWNNCPMKSLSSKFKAEFLVELRMNYSELEKLWEGTQQLISLKTITMSCSESLKIIPNLSKAINLKTVDFSHCVKLESFPSPLNSKSLEYLNLFGCPRLENFPQIKMESLPHGIEIYIYDCLWNKNLPGYDYLDCFKSCYPIKFLPEHIVSLTVNGNTLEKLWEGVQWLGSVYSMDLSKSEKLKEIPDLSKATNLTYLNLSNCKSLVRLPSTIGNLQKLDKLVMENCTGLKVLLVDVNLSSLKTLNVDGCSSLTSFPQLPRSIQNLYLDDTAIEEVPCCIEMFRRLTRLSMRRCNKLKNISPNIFRLTNLKHVDFTDCGVVISVVAKIEDTYENIEKGNKVDKYKDKGPWNFKFDNCLKLDKDARELIVQSSLKWTMVLPGGEVPTYFNHRAFGDSLTVSLPQSSLSHQFLRFNVCLVVQPLAVVVRRLHLHFRFNGIYYMHNLNLSMLGMWKKDHLVFCSFKIRTTGLPCTLEFNDVEFKFKFKSSRVKESSRRIKEVGIQLLNAAPSLDDRDRISSETEYNKQFGEQCEDVDAESSKKLMQMTSSEENFNLPCDQIVTETGKSSSVYSYPCLEREALCIYSMITEEQDAQLSIVDPSLEPDIIWRSSRSTSSERASNASIFFYWGGLLLVILCTLLLFSSLFGRSASSGSY